MSVHNHLPVRLQVILTRCAVTCALLMGAGGVGCSGDTDCDRGTPCPVFEINEWCAESGECTSDREPIQCGPYCELEPGTVATFLVESLDAQFAAFDDLVFHTTCLVYPCVDFDSLQIEIDGVPGTVLPSGNNNLAARKVSWGGGFPQPSSMRTVRFESDSTMVVRTQLDLVDAECKEDGCAR